MLKVKKKKKMAISSMVDKFPKVTLMISNLDMSYISLSISLSWKVRIIIFSNLDINCIYISKSSTSIEAHDPLYATEVLNALKFTRVPNNKLTLKLGCMVMLTRNISPRSELYIEKKIDYYTNTSKHFKGKNYFWI